MTPKLMGLMALCFPLVAFAGGGDDEGRPGANQEIESRSARQQAGQEFDQATARPPVLHEEVPTVIDEPAPTAPVTPEEQAVATATAAELVRQPGETRTDHVRRLLEERAILAHQISTVEGDGNVVIQVGRDLIQERAAAAAEQARLEGIDTELRALRARATAIEAALETAQIERRALRTDLDALDARVTTELERIDRDTEFLGARIADNIEALEAHQEILDGLIAADLRHDATDATHTAAIERGQKGNQSTVGLYSRMRASSHGSDLAIGLATSWAAALGDKGAWMREHELAATYHPNNSGVGAGLNTRFIVQVNSDLPLWFGPEIGIHHAVLGWTDGGGRASGALTALDGGLYVGFRPRNGSFTASLTAGVDGGYLGLAGPDTGTWAPGAFAGVRFGWGW